MYNNLIWSKDDSLNKSFCDHIIEKFENDPNKRDGVVGSNAPRVDKNIKVTTDFTISRSPDWKEEDDILFKALAEGLKEYKNYLLSKHDHLIPNLNYLMKDAGYKIQRYDPYGFYDWHNDWVMDKNGSRVFVFMWYLNTIKIKDGGYTEFLSGKRIQPKCGKLVFFPATWTYVHRGYRPLVRKYLCNGWIYAKPY